MDKQACRRPHLDACVWAIGAARDPAVGAVHRDSGSTSTACPDYCFDQAACSEAASTRCAFIPTGMTQTGSAAEALQPCWHGCSSGSCTHAPTAEREQVLKSSGAFDPTAPVPVDPRALLG